MGLIPVGAIFKGFTFDGEDSKDYGVYISGDAVFNAPERAVDMIEIPGRNGAYALDLGRFENIEVKYPAGIAADNETDFASGISDFRNFLASRRGYCRLEDEYNPDEYRLAVYRRGLEVTPAQLKAGEFEIVFDCMPQRFLKSGESAVTLASGDTITNPTLFESPPLIIAAGYGTINIGDYPLALNQGVLGNINVYESYVSNYPLFFKFVCKSGLYQAGDSLTVSNIRATPGDGNITITDFTGDTAAYYEGNTFGFADAVFTAGTAETKTCTLSTNEYGTSRTHSIYLRYDGDATVWLQVGSGYSEALGLDCSVSYAAQIIAESSVPGIQKTIDAETGEVYAVVGDELISANHLAVLQPALPTLPPGAITITYDNTITDLQIVPRWWRV